MLPSRTDTRWKTLVLHPEKFTLQFLALKILMQRIAMRKIASAGAELDAAVDEVIAMFQKNERLMSKDIAAIFG
jgi:hypothetical protein